MVTFVYLCVVERFLWPKSSCIDFRSMLGKRWVAKLWRKACGVKYSGNPNALHKERKILL